MGRQFVIPNVEKNEQVEALLARNPANENDTLSWLADVWQYFLESGLYFAGGPADDSTLYRLQLIEKAQATARQQDILSVWAEANRITAHVMNAGERYKEATHYYALAIEQLEALGDMENAIRTRLGYGAALMTTGFYEEALSVCNVAKAWFAKNNDQNYNARVLINIGNIYHRMDEHAKALECQLEAAALFESIGSAADWAVTSHNIANGYTFLDRFEEADEMYLKSYEIASANDLTSLSDQARYNRSYLHFLRGRYSDAITSFNELRLYFGNERSVRHAALCDLDQSEIYLQLNMPADAARLATSASDAFSQIDMAYEEAKAIAFRGVAETQRHRFQEALEYFQQSVPIFEAEGNEFWIGMLEIYRAEVLLGLGRHWEAKFLGESALENFERQGIAYQHGMALILLGRVAIAMEQNDEVVRLSGLLLDLISQKNVPLLEFPAQMLCAQISERTNDLEEAERLYTLAANAIEEHRSYLHHDELRIRFVDGKEAVYEALVQLSLRHDERLAFTWCERAKARALADLLGQHLPSVSTQSDTDLLDHIQRLREELNSQYVRSRPEGGEFEAPPKEQIEQTEQELETAFRKMSDVDAEFGALFGVLPANLETIQAILPGDVTVAEFYISRGEVMLFLITQTSYRVVRRLSSVEKVQQLKQGLQFQMQKFALGREYLQQHEAQMLEATNLYLARLYADLFAPWVDDITTQKIVLIPHQDLHGLPLHALSDGKSYLIDRFQISYAPSSEVFRFTMAQPEATGAEGLFIGFADDNAPLIDEELDRLSKLAPAAEFISGSEATRGHLFESVQGSRYLHISTHSFFRKDNPMFSGFHLKDGPVTALDLYSKSWPMDLVTLSGCSSGVSSISSGDDLVGLVRGFFHAGAKSLLMSLWHVSDEATTELTESFYQHWLDHGDKAKALQQAMISVREHYPHPFYWAPFMLLGAT
tara:strand:- start:810 stop:3635 length:2826 start_codon:yes stop_codon:yes gene_type:complete